MTVLNRPGWGKKFPSIKEIVDREPKRLRVSTENDKLIESDNDIGFGRPGEQNG